VSLYHIFSCSYCTYIQGEACHRLTNVNSPTASRLSSKRLPTPLAQTANAADVTCAKNCFCNARTCRCQERSRRMLIVELWKALLLLSQTTLGVI
jgi:hypothetical protein